MNSPKSGGLFSRQWWGLLAISVLVSALTAGLGVWQLERAKIKTAWHALQIDRQRLPPLTNIDWQTPAQTEQWLHRSVQVQGQWLSNYTIYLANRSLGSQSGFYILTPLQLTEGPVLWIQRGWIARDRVRSDFLPPIVTPAGLVSVQGRVILPPSKLLALGADDSDRFTGLRQNVDLDQFRAQTGLNVVGTLLQTEGPVDGLSRQWPLLNAGADKNQGYALQWFALSLLCLFLFAWFQIWKKRSHDCP